MKFQLYKDKKKEWRWRLLARNGRTVADSGEGYKRKGKCVREVEKIIMGVESATLEFV